MKGKELFNVLILCCCLLILCGSFLPYISVDFPGTNAGQGAKSVAQQQLPELMQEDGSFDAAAVDIISTMQTENKGGFVKAWFIVTLFLNLVSVLSLLAETNKKFLLIFFLDLLQMALWAGGVFILLPYGLVKASGIVTTAYTQSNAVINFLTRTQEAAELRSLLLHSMRAGYWMQYLFAFLSAILCVTALIRKPRSARQRQPKRRTVPQGVPEQETGYETSPAQTETGYVYQNEYRPDGMPGENAEGLQGQDEQNSRPLPGITCVAGPYAGSHAPMAYDEELVIGSDEDACSLVIMSRLVSPVHCRLFYDPERDEYHIMSTSAAGTYVNQFRIDENVWLPLQRGACIRLGRDENILRLD